MKKLVTISVLIALAMGGFAQQFNFSAVCESGQTLYYRITDAEAHTVILTHPVSENYIWFQGDYYEGFVHPAGEIILSSVVVSNDIDYTVTAIDSCTFWECNITSVFIPSSISYIAPTAFAYCESLEALTADEANPTFYSENNAFIRREDKALVAGCKTTAIPNDIETICAQAFRGSGDSGDLIIPNSVKTIEEWGFSSSRFSGSIILSDSLETIGQYAFYSCHVSGSLVIPNSVKEIGERAFWYCQNLTGNLTLSSSLTSIENMAFEGFGFSGTLIIPNSVKHIGYYAFAANNFSELILGDSVTTIEERAFVSCNNLTGVLRLPASLTEIGTKAFGYTAFTEIFSPNTIPPTTAFNAFIGNDTNTPIHIPFGCTETYQNAEGWNYFTNFIESETNLEGEWYYEILNDDGSITYQHLEYAADTTIGTSRPKVIVRSNTHYDRDTITEVTHEYILEENGKVYWWNNTMQEFTILYDYYAEIGDEWEIEVENESLTIHVDAVESVEYDGRTYRMLRVSDAGDLFSGDIMCGIGHMTSFFPEKLMSQDKGFRVDGLRCYWVEDALLYHNGDEDCDAIHSELQGMEEDGASADSRALVVYPNPASGVLFVETQTFASLPDQTYCITNLMGQTLLQGSISAENQQIDIANLPAGMYFFSVGGQTVKFVVK